MEELDIDVFIAEANEYGMPTAFAKIPDIDDILDNMTYDERSKRLRQLYSISKKGKRRLYEKLLHSEGYCSSEIIILAAAFLSKEQINNLIDNMRVLNRCHFEELIIAAGRASEFINTDARYIYNFYDRDIKELIIATGKQENYLDKDLLEGIVMDRVTIVSEIIYSLENMEDYLDCNKLEKLGLNYDDAFTSFIYNYDGYLLMDLAVKNSYRLNLTQEDINTFKNIVATSKKIEQIQNRSPEDCNKNLLQCNTKLTIPEEMKVGTEIECFGTLYWKYVYKYFQNKYKWEAKDDLSIDSGIKGEIGIEVTSPILTGPCRKSEKQIIGVCSDLVEVGQKTNGSCGGHIHIDSNYLSNVHAYQNLLDLWCNLEKVLYIISNESGTINREDTARYAKPISKQLVYQMENGMVDFSDSQTIEELKVQLKNFQCQFDEDFEYQRYTGINFYNIDRSGTIEFRVPNGSLNPDVWIQNINLFGGLVKVAQDLSVLQDKNIGELTPDEYHKLELFEVLKTEPLYEEEKLHILLELVIPEENRFIYEERFKKNSSLLKAFDGIDKSISEEITDKKVNLSPNIIGKRCFTGENSLTMDELSVVDDFVKKEKAGQHRVDSKNNPDKGD
ncbi:MAG: amidoligase family protein [Clostridia bacterium]|nr:amidoligase family protein [Clostridia bacterium]